MIETTWTWQAVRDRIVEARATAMLLPEVQGPQAFGCLWPEIVSDYGNPRVFRPRASPSALDRMEEVLRWYAALPTDAERHLLNDYAYVKTSPRVRFGAWCEKNGWPERIFRRRVQLVCQRVADDLNHSARMRRDAEDCVLSENEEELDLEALPSKPVPYDRAADARPKDLPQHPDRAAVVRRMQRWATERSRRARNKRRSPLMLRMNERRERPFFETPRSFRQPSIGFPLLLVLTLGERAWNG